MKKRIGSSYIAWRSSLVKLGEPLAIDAVVFLEAAEVQPVAGELRGQAPDAVVAEHAPRLRDQHLRLVQVAGGGVCEQLVVGHARPEEVAQPAGQGVVRQRLRGLARPGPIEAVAEVGRQQHAGDRVADRVLVAQPVLLAQLAVEGEQVVVLRRRQRPAIGPLGERRERLEMARLRGPPGLLDPADLGGHVGEVGLDRLDRFGVRPDLPRLGQVGRRRAASSWPRRSRPCPRSGRSRTRPRRMNRGGSARSKKMKSLYCRIGARVTKFELLPERVELAPARLVEDQFAERLVVAEVALHQVEAGRQQPPAPAALGIEVGGPIGHEERVGEDPAELLEVARRRRLPGTACAGRRAGDFSRGRSGWLPAEMPFTCILSTLRLEALRASSMTRSRIRSQPRRASSCASASAGNSRHSAWTSPSGPDSGQGSCRIVQTVARYSGAEPGLAGEVAERRIRLAERVAVLEPPGGQEVVGVVDLVPLVERR